MMNVLAEEKPKSIILADGKEYVLPPIDLTTLANIEQTLGFSLGSFAAKMDAQPMTTLRALAYALLKENHPELTLEAVGHLVSMKQISELSTTISTVIAVAT
jgi:hypothetical protein